ncbi:MAG: LURP-one-related family protein [Solobacterium sp.]|nr:LURP-one-related family protein [Solobacterium sp.]
MGFLSDLIKLGEAVSGGINKTADDLSKTTIDDYGTPEYTLYTALKLADLHSRINITNEEDNLRYYTKSSIITITGKTDIMDAEGNVVAHLEKKPISLHETHYVTMADGTHFTLSNELFHIVDDITRIDELGWQLRGNFIGLTFNLLDENSEPIATVRKQMVSIHDKYCIDIYQPELEPEVVAIVIQLEKMLEDRRQNQSHNSNE